MSSSGIMCVSDEVNDAISDGRPVVALESTLIAHGFPPERRHDVAHRIEKGVRDGGAVPATIMIHGGVVHVGVDDSILEHLSGSDAIVKTGIDNLPITLATGATGATTVASAVLLASRAGISVFTTGGLGGVHRGASETFDVSADLKVLAEHRIVAVCAGVKSILDVPATLEVLETLGVTVMTLGSETFPAYYVMSSGVRSDQVATPANAADVFMARTELGVVGSIVLACPPSPGVALDQSDHDEALSAGLREAAMVGARGKDVTPIIMRHLSRVTHGRSSTAGLVITTETARIAARVAVELVR